MVDCAVPALWIALLVLLNAVEALLLIVVVVRVNHARADLIDAIDARLLEVEGRGRRLAS